MLKMNISLCKGRGSLAHNNREFHTPNVDKSRSHLNITYKQEPLPVAYDKLFGDEIKIYNAKQKRKDRQIPNYMEHIRKSKNGEKLFYEIVVQIGNKYTCNTSTENGELAKKILSEYMIGFETRNPNLYVFNAVLHFDEQTPHLHIDYIPVARGYKNGLQIRNSLDKAFKQQGIDGKGGKQGNSTQHWQELEKKQLATVMERYNWERAPDSGLHQEKMTLSQYKATMRDVENQVKELPEQIEKKTVPFVKDKVLVNVSDLEALELRAKLSITHEQAFEGIQNKMNDKISEVDNYMNEKLAELQIEKEKVEQSKKLASQELTEYKSTKEKYQELYEEQKDLNQLYRATKEENTLLKAENNALKSQIDDLKEEIIKKVQEVSQPLIAQIETLKRKLEDTYKSLANVIKAINMLKYDNINGYKIQNLSKKQDRLIDGLAEYGSKLAKRDKFPDLAEEMKKDMGISNDLKKLVKQKEHDYER